MKRLRYFIRVIHECRMQQFWQAVQKVCEETGRAKLRVAGDMFRCALRYGAGYHDYVVYGFAHMKRQERKTYLTRIQNGKLISLVNDTKYVMVFEDKARFSRCFSEYLQRDFLLMENAAEEEIEAFLQKHEVVFAKSREDGRYMERLVVSEFETPHKLTHYVMNPIKNFTVLEEEVRQHEAVSRLYPGSVNCLRVVTLIDDAGEPQCLYAVLKTGNAGRWTDSRREDSLVCPVNLETGRLMGKAYTPAMKNYELHPYTGTKLKDYQLPFISEAVQMVKEVSLIVPQMRYMGWNVALTEKGPVLMEGVPYPEYDYGQLPEFTAERGGLLSVIRKYVKEMQ